MKRFLSTWSVLLIAAVSSFVVVSCSSDDDDDAVKVENKVGGKVPKVSEAVDLGLSVKWAPWNVGASQPTDYGEYFPWGEVTLKIDNEGYRVYEVSYSKAKYNEYDGKTTLDASDDAATANWGSNWRMPTYEEWRELINNTTWELKENYNDSGNGVYVFKSKITGYEDVTFLLPAAGYFSRYEKKGTVADAVYWSSTLDPYSEYGGWFESLDYGPSVYLGGLPVRAVCP